ncbi:MAG TPA: hypothetical protein VGF75_03950 [Candidatus Saccharimonadales bacterium]|jgi:hypothetical protein
MPAIQYTIRNIPPVVDQVIRKRSKLSGKSFNQTVVDILSMQTLGSTKPKLDNNFDWLFNKGAPDEGFDEAIKDLSKVDEEMWR